jgi:phosphoesterase RecJ-like protein
MNKIFDTDIIDTFKNSLNEAKQICIIGHKNIDADSLGSALAIARFFEKKGIKTKIIAPDSLPDFFKWIDDLDKIITYELEPWEAVDFISFSDVIFFVDWGAYNRIGNLKDAVEISNSLKIMIDHHQEPQQIADFSFVDSSRSSAAELVYEFLKIIDKNNIDKKIAEYIYLGIVSDTGSFKYDSVDSQTFKTAAELLDYKINKSLIINKLYNNFSFDRLKFLGFVISNRLIYMPEKHIAYIYISEKDKKKFNYKNGDHENFVNWPLAISDVKMSALILETDNNVKISLRSTGNFDVNKIARKFFSGGGHKNAAGGKSELSFDDTLKMFQQNIDQMIQIAEN